MWPLPPQRRDRVSTYAMGALTMEDAIIMAYYRGVAAADQVQQRLEREVGGLSGSSKIGGMMSVGMTKDDAQLYLDRLYKGKAAIPCVNSLSSLTISGDEDAIDVLNAELDERRTFAQADEKLKVGSICYVSALARGKSAVKTFLDLGAKLYTQGWPVNFAAINRPNLTFDAHHSIAVFDIGVPQCLIDLPPYPGNHSGIFWAEPRISKVYRKRQHARTDLLGVPDWHASEAEPRWRKHLRSDELPWVYDHRIQSNIVYPAAEYLAMAIEALKQCVSGTSPPHSAHLARLGLEYGETFANVVKARGTAGTCLAKVTIADTVAPILKNFDVPFVTHPSTLDSILHTNFGAVSASETFQLHDPAISSSIKELDLS
ncbi:hypothetical protein N0V93_010339 [Gnomoniopsis smithogilvyi]|uniref:PKS/mFAS DH domain-containing protein n=1 Tax=Gnomoniopsis smithogilvyi TaxID=1191159 RepID=A0A9W9CSS6_9PEZI|nr:hypothetical protein N0V93_010339 [Gnomoniopsis smithogilvyi]